MWIKNFRTEIVLSLGQLININSYFRLELELVHALSTRQSKKWVQYQEMSGKTRNE